MKKSYLTIILFSFLLNSVIGQDSKADNHEIGVDMSEVIKKLFFPTDEPSFSTGDYFLLYKYNLKNFSLRLRLGGDIRTSSLEGEDITSSSPNRKSEFREINIAFGLEKSSRFKGKWFYNYGFEGIYHQGYALTTGSGNQGEYPEVINKSTSYGLSFILGIEYSIKPWLSIGTESSLRMVKRKNSTEYVFEMIGNSRASSGSKNFNTTYRPTNGIFVMIHF